MLYTQLLKFLAITNLTAIHSYHPVTAGSRQMPIHIWEGFDALFASMDQYSSRKPTFAPFPTAIQEQMLSLKNQVSDVIQDFGCRIEKEPDSVCMDLFMREEYLEVEIVRMAKMWYVSERIRRELAQAVIMGEMKREGWVLSWLHVRKNAPSNVGHNA